jgi:cytochrome c-type protein NapC
MDVEKQKARASKMHKIAQDDKKTCIDCHKGIAHKKPKNMPEEDDE